MSFDGFSPEPLQTQGAAQQIANQIRRAVLRGQLVQGERLPSELELASRYSVSRGTIRETMKLLAAAGLVESTRGAQGGTFVSLPQPDDLAAAVAEAISVWFNAGRTSLAEVNDAREWIERGCVRMATRNRTDQDLDTLSTAVEAMEQPGVTIEDMLALDIDFHVGVSRAAHNDVLEMAMNAIHLVRPYTNTLIVPLLEIEKLSAQHRTIYEAIDRQQIRLAEKAFDEHLAYLEAVRVRALASRRPQDVPLSDLAGEAHPAFERLKDRLVEGRLHP